MKELCRSFTDSKYMDLKTSNKIVARHAHRYIKVKIPVWCHFVFHQMPAIPSDASSCKNEEVGDIPLAVFRVSHKSRQGEVIYLLLLHLINIHDLITPFH